MLLGNNCPPAATEAATVRAVASRRGELTSKSSSISVLEAQSCQSLLRARPAAPVGVLCAVGAAAGRRAAGSVSPHRSIGAGSKTTGCQGALLFDLSQKGGGFASVPATWRFIDGVLVRLAGERAWAAAASVRARSQLTSFARAATQGRDQGA